MQIWTPLRSILVTTGRSLSWTCMGMLLGWLLRAKAPLAAAIAFWSGAGFAIFQYLALTLLTLPQRAPRLPPSPPANLEASGAPAAAVVESA